MCNSPRTFTGAALKCLIALIIFIPLLNPWAHLSRPVIMASHEVYNYVWLLAIFSLLVAWIESFNTIKYSQQGWCFLALASCYLYVLWLKPVVTSTEGSYHQVLEDKYGGFMEEPTIYLRHLNILSSDNRWLARCGLVGENLSLVVDFEFSKD